MNENLKTNAEAEKFNVDEKFEFDGTELEYTSEENQAIKEDQNKRQLMEKCYNSVGYTIYELWRNGEVKIETSKQNLQDVNDLLDDIKEIEEWK